MLSPLAGGWRRPGERLKDSQRAAPAPTPTPSSSFCELKYLQIQRDAFQDEQRRAVPRGGGGSSRVAALCSPAFRNSHLCPGRSVSHRGPPWRWEPSAGVLRAQKAPESHLPSGVCVCVCAREHIGGRTRPHTDVSPLIHFQSLSVITRRSQRGRCAVKKGFNYL